MQLRHGSLFSGIGGFDLAAEWAGWKNVLQCENDEFCRKVLDYYWPDVPTLDDIKNVDFKKYEGTVDVISGGFPCQPFSQAGKRKGSSDNRYLWPEMLRAIQEVKPRWVVGENVLGIVNWNRGMVFKQVITDLENSGYQVQTFIIPACSKNAPHRRDRVWFVAHSECNGHNGECTITQGQQFKRRRKARSKSASFINNETASDTASIGLCSNCEGQRFQPTTFGTQQSMGEGIAPDSDSDGCDRFHGKYEKHPSERGVNALNDIKQTYASDTDTTRFTDRGKKHRRKQTQSRTRKYRPCGCGIGVAADTGKKQLQRSKFNRGIKRTRKIKRESRQFMRPICSTWEDFPTQSPICGRNDGVSRKLDSITFSKWRIESIKAYGNAIVPQIALAIFDSINKYEESLC